SSYMKCTTTSTTRTAKTNSVVVVVLGSTTTLLSGIPLGDEMETKFAEVKSPSAELRVLTLEEIAQVLKEMGLEMDPPPPPPVEPIVSPLPNEDDPRVTKIMQMRDLLGDK